MTGVEEAVPSIVDRVVRLGRALERAGVPVGAAATLDACRALEHIDLVHRAELREGLRATLVKSAGFRDQFDAAFDRVFPVRAKRADREARSTPLGPAELAQAVAGSDDLGPVAAGLVDEHGGLDGDVRTEKHHVQRVLRAADLARLMSRARIQDPDVSPHQLRARIDELKRLITADVRGRIGGRGDDEPIGLDLIDIEFLTASRSELDDMRDAIRPLARRLATRLARRRQNRRSGRVNLRHTMRRSLATGGVPFDVAFHRPRPRRPELHVLCDVSGSVADFSVFTLSLMAALSAELPRTRSYVFVDAIDEVTELLRATDHEIEPWQIMRNTNVIGADGHSDYGAVLEQFWSDYGDDRLRSSSTVVITGDARNNHRDTRRDVLERIAQRCRRVYWLNPEPEAEWNTYDSEMGDYGASCDAVFEVRTLRQLVACIERIL
jgi:uncharacterized protein with von Willebrand factor type A (vWA) domain